VAKIAVLEEQLQAATDRGADLDRELAERRTELSEARQTLETREAELEQERATRRAQVDTQSNDDNVLRQSYEKVCAENESLVKQVDLLQRELSVMAQDLNVLQKQDTFRASAMSNISLSTC
jgi:chromosome segregation ATPase